MPNFVTPYHRAGRRPFLNLSELTALAVAAVMELLDGDTERQSSHRRFGPHYMELRRATEAHTRRAFLLAGGRPSRTSPHYFVLGESSWFRQLYSDAGEVRVAVSDLPAEVTSFTLADSISAMGLGAKFGVPAPYPSHLGQVYRLDQLQEVMSQFGMPGPATVDAAGYQDHQWRPVDHYVEVQLWSDAPVMAYLRRAT